MVANPLCCFEDNNEVDNPFTNSNNSANVMVVVEETLLYVNDDILKVLSPVFNAMLSDNFKEGQQKKIELPGKKASDIIRMFRFFYPEKRVTITSKFNYYPILALCQEYQLDWLKDLLENKMKENLLIDLDSNLMTDEMLIYYLYLAEQFSLVDLKEACIGYHFKSNFLRIKEIKTFKILSKDARLDIFKFFFYKRLGNHVVSCRKICFKTQETDDDALFNYIDIATATDGECVIEERDEAGGSAAKKRKIEIKENIKHEKVENPLRTVVSETGVIENPFSIAYDINNVTLVVENIELHLKAGVLQVHAPVLWKHISEEFSEEEEFFSILTVRKVELKDKKAIDVINLLRFIHPDKAIPLEDSSDFYSLYQLCDEYKIDWLKNKITNYIVKRLTEICPITDSTENPTKESVSDHMLIYFLYLSEVFKIDVLREICFGYSFQLYFYLIKNNTYFHLLSRKTKLSIYKYCVKRRLLMTDFSNHAAEQKFSSKTKSGKVTNRTDDNCLCTYVGKLCV